MYMRKCLISSSGVGGAQGWRVYTLLNLILVNIFSIILLSLDIQQNNKNQTLKI